MRPDRVWYIAYGSNVNSDRFRRYLRGDATHVGARDPSDPAAGVWATAALRLTFAGVSQRWNGGGVAFVTPDSAAEAHVRLWDITSEQFEDVFAQENRRPPGESLDWASLVDGPLEAGTGWYRSIRQVVVDGIELDRPAVTFTWAEPAPFNPPNPDYLAAIREGLGENAALHPTTIDTYLSTHAGR